MSGAGDVSGVNFNQFGMANSIVNGVEGVDVRIVFILYSRVDNGVCHAKLIDVHPPNIYCNLLLTKIFNSQISVGTCHSQRVAILVLCDANRFEPQNTDPLTF